MTLRDSWHEQADDWVAWARTTGHDSYWTFHRAAFLPLVPSPGRLTVDIGCGEGRVSRDLVALGHRVVAVDSSPAMCHATAAHPTDPVPTVVADATQLPFATASVDCAVAFMSLHDVDEVEAAIGEIARILEPGGRLTMAIVHPMNSFNAAPTDSYFQRSLLADKVDRDGLTITFHMEHRPLQTYTEALVDSGFVIERVREPGTTDPESLSSRFPLFLNMVVRR